MFLIGENWRIDSDPLNVTVYKRYVSKNTGKEYWQAEYYYGSIKDALDGLVEHEIMGQGFEDFRALAKKVQDIHDLIASLPAGTCASV